jgi:transcriptional regulator of acetoin/glycerol metabolism
MRRHGGNVTDVAHALGIDRSSLYDRLKRHGIPR